MFDMVPFHRNNQVARREDFVNQLFDHFFSGDFFSPFATSGIGGFRMDLTEEANAYHVEADLPGIRKGDITLEFMNNYLTITAKREELQETGKQENYLCRERHYGQFQRSVYLNNVDEEGITAEFKDGVLKVTLPKHDTTRSMARNIPIK